MSLELLHTVLVTLLFVVGVGVLFSLPFAPYTGYTNLTSSQKRDYIIIAVICLLFIVVAVLSSH